MVEFGTSSTIRGWVRVRVLGYGSGVRGRKAKSRDCALASDLVKAAAASRRGSGPDNVWQQSLGSPGKGKGRQAAARLSNQ